jgi:hypothetical protein
MVGGLREGCLYTPKRLYGTRQSRYAERPRLQLADRQDRAEIPHLKRDPKQLVEPVGNSSSALKKPPKPVRYPTRWISYESVCRMRGAECTDSITVRRRPGVEAVRPHPRLVARPARLVTSWPTDAAPPHPEAARSGCSRCGSGARSAGFRPQPSRESTCPDSMPSSPKRCSYCSGRG